MASFQTAPINYQSAPFKWHVNESGTNQSEDELAKEKLLNLTPLTLQLQIPI